MYNERITKLLENIGENDAYLITDPKNCFYFSGIRSSNITLIISHNMRYLITDFRYEILARENKAGFTVLTKDGIFSYVKEMLSQKNIYTELDKISYEFFGRLKACTTGKILPIGNTVTNLRNIKSDTEISLIKKAQEIADSAFLNTLPLMREGMTELELKAELEYRMALGGAEKTSFDTIALFGSHTALPHGEPSNIKLKNKDIILIDFGCVYGGYCSDNTRTFFFGNPDDEMKRAYNAVNRAHMLARDFITVNCGGKAADKIARDYLDKCGYENLFGHSLGHGVGLDIHENLRLSPKSEDILPENSVFSIEPGIYIKNKFGIRIEDIYVLKKDGLHSLTALPKELTIL